MNKLISKNPIQRFKQGQKIQRFLGGGIPFAASAKKYGLRQNAKGERFYRNDKGDVFFEDGRIIPNNKSGKVYRTNRRNVGLHEVGVVATPTKRKVDSGADWRAAHQAQSEKAQANKPQVNKSTSGQSGRGTKANTRTNSVQTTTSPQAGTSSSNTPTLSNTYVGYATPETSRVQNVNQNWTYNVGNTSGGFVPTQSSAQKLDEGPSFYGEGLTDFNRGSIRGFRNQDGGFRNVDEYYTWLNNNQNSDQYKLWNNVLEGMDDETRRNTFYQIMNQFGISGNLGRRDSGRLAEVLNTLRDLGVNGSANQKAFMNSYNTALNNELAEGRRNASPITSYTEQFRNQILNSKPSLATPPFIAIPRYDENGRPLAYSYKQGGLISKNPVKQFKTNFRKGAL